MPGSFEKHAANVLLHNEGRAAIVMMQNVNQVANPCFFMISMVPFPSALEAKLFQRKLIVVRVCIRSGPSSLLHGPGFQQSPLPYPFSHWTALVSTPLTSLAPLSLSASLSLH